MSFPSFNATFLGGCRRDARLVGYHDDGFAVDGGEVAEEFANAFAIGRVEVAGGFVGKDHGGVGDEGAADGDALLFAAGHGVGAVGFASGEAEIVQELRDFAAVGDVGFAFEHEGEQDVLLGGQGGDEVEGLEDQADVTAAEEREVAVGHGAEVLAVDEDLTGVGVGESRHEMQEGAFAGAGSAHDGKELAALDGEGDTGQSGNRAVSLVKIFRDVLDDKGGHGVDEL